MSSSSGSKVRGGVPEPKDSFTPCLTGRQGACGPSKAAHHHRPLVAAVARRRMPASPLFQPLILAWNPIPSL